MVEVRLGKEGNYAESEERALFPGKGEMKREIRRDQKHESSAGHTEKRHFPEPRNRSNIKIVRGYSLGCVRLDGRLRFSGGVKIHRLIRGRG